MTGSVDFALAPYLEAERGRVEEALERALAWLGPRLDPALADAVRHAVTTGGKRLRPILCATAYRSCGGRGQDEAVYDLAVSIELIHAYSLAHDDLPCMDDAELRRGAPTTHRVHGEDLATLAGATLIPAAALQAVRASKALALSQDRAGTVVLALLRASGAGGMVGGQWLDLLGEGRALDGAALDRLHAHKTGALLTASLEMGAEAAEAAPSTVSAMRRYGQAIGLAFQIADDVLDATASAEVLGKNPSDAALAKSTYVSLHGLARARERARAVVDDGIRALDEAEIDAPVLRALAYYVVDRDH